MWWAPDKGLFFKHRWLNGCLLQRVVCNERQISSSNLCKHLTVQGMTKTNCSVSKLQIPGALRSPRPSAPESPGHSGNRDWLGSRSLTSSLRALLGPSVKQCSGIPPHYGFSLAALPGRQFQYSVETPDASKTSQEGFHSLGLLMIVSTTVLFPLNSAKCSSLTSNSEVLNTPKCSSVWTRPPLHSGLYVQN